MTRADVVRAAAQLAAAKGAPGLTMRGVARELGVSPMALYNHVESRRDLLDAMAESFLRYAAQTARPGDLAGTALELLEHYLNWPYLISVLREADSPAVRAAYCDLSELACGGNHLAQTFLAYDILAQGLVERSRTHGDVAPRDCLRAVLGLP